MVFSQALVSLLIGTLIGIFYGFLFTKGRLTSSFVVLLQSVGRYALLLAITLLINYLFPLNLLLYVTGFFTAFWLFIHKTIRMGL